MRRTSVLLLLAVSMLVVVIPVGASAKQPMVDVCHFDADNEVHRLLSISEKALGKHLSEHPDGVPGGPIPGLADDYFFADDCSQDRTPLQPVTYACDTSAVVYERLYVSADAGGTMDGSPTRPFAAVSQALQAALDGGIAAVEVQVAGGMYAADNAAITRDTRIVGPGRAAAVPAELALTLTHTGSADIGIQGVVFTPNGDQPAVTFEPVASPQNPGADTALCNLGFYGITGHGFGQAGGTLDADDVIVADTAKRYDAPTATFRSGSGLLMGAGIVGAVDATLNNVQLTNNQGSGIATSGGSNVTITGSTIHANKTAGVLAWGQSKVGIQNSTITGDEDVDLFESGIVAVGINTGVTISNSTISDHAGCHGGINVSESASLTGTGLTLANNYQTGVYAAGVETTVDLEDVDIATTRGRMHIRPECPWDSASGVAVFDQAVMTVTDFDIHHGELIGVQQGNEGLLILTDGTVRFHPIGANIQDSGYDLTTLRNNVLWLDNEVNIDAQALPVPEPQVDLDSL